MRRQVFMLYEKAVQYAKESLLTIWTVWWDLDQMDRDSQSASIMAMFKNKFGPDYFIQKYKIH